MLDFVINKLNHHDEIRKEYYNRVNIEQLIPEDLLSSIISNLPFKDMSRASIVSSTLYNAYKTALNHENLSLTIDSFDEYYWDQNNRSLKHNLSDNICFSESWDNSESIKPPTFEIKYVRF